MHIDPNQGHPDMDYAEHAGTYKLFCGLFFWGTLACVALLAGMAIFLV